MMRPRDPRGSAPVPLEDDQGTAIIESAFVLPLLLLLVFGIFEFGLLFRSYLSSGDAIGDASRIGAIVGPDRLYLADDDAFVGGDYAIISALREGTASIDADDIERVVVFRANAPGLGSALSQVPHACKTASGSLSGLACNVYPAEEAFYQAQEGNASYFDCIDGDGTRACGWPPSERNDGPEATDIDYLGVYVKYQHEWVTGIFGSNITIEQATIVRLEPGAV
jgi:hypothetical protein